MPQATPTAPAARTDDRFVSMKVRGRMHRWIKARAAERGVAMYALLEEWLGTLHGAKPWESADVSEPPSDLAGP